MKTIKAIIEEIEKFDATDGIISYYKQVNLWDDISKIFFKKGERIANEEGFEKHFQSLDEIMSKIINVFIKNVESDSNFKKLGYSTNGLRDFPLYVYLSRYFHGMTDIFYTIVNFKSKWNKEFVDEMSLLIPELNKVLKKFKMWIKTR